MKAIKPKAEAGPTPLAISFTLGVCKNPLRNHHAVHFVIQPKLDPTSRLMNLIAAFVAVVV
jgi:hypothetical protein